MKSKDLQTAVKNKYENGSEPAKVYRDLGGVVSKRTMNLWIKMIKKILTLSTYHTLLGVLVQRLRSLRRNGVLSERSTCQPED